MRRFLLPLIVFAVLAIGLGLKPAEVPSPLIGKPVPAFSLAQVRDASRTIASRDMLGEVWLLDVWASWCNACRDEHPALLAFAQESGVPVIGLNYKDKQHDGKAWLERHGDPYRASALDEDGRVGIDFGVYGVPETFVIDKRGVIRFKHIGPLTPEQIRTELLPLLKELDRV